MHRSGKQEVAEDVYVATACSPWDQSQDLVMKMVLVGL